MGHHDREIVVYRTPDALFAGAADRFVECAKAFQSQYGWFRVALSGGQTPKGLFERLANPGMISQVDWARVHVYWGDERHVPPYSEDSNFHMARQTLLGRTHVPPENMHRIMSELPSAERAAQDYERTLQASFGIDRDEFPRFDLVLLGLGPDGHTASLFPNSPALDVTDRSVVANYVPSIQRERITLTYPTINNAANIWFLVSGSGKANVVGQVLGAPGSELPAAKVAPTDGNLVWLLDADAASKLDEKGLNRVK